MEMEIDSSSVLAGLPADRKSDGAFLKGGDDFFRICVFWELDLPFYRSLAWLLNFLGC